MKEPEGISGPEPAKRNLLDRTISYFSPTRGARRAAARQIIELTASYRAAETTRLRHSWLLLDDGPTPLSTDLETLRNRSRDANRNDPIASGATDTLKTNIVGSGLKAQSGIRAAVIGISDDRSKALRIQAEYAFSEFSRTADAANILTFDEIQFLAIAKIIEDGETIAIPTWVKNDPWRTYSRCIELIESERLTAAFGGKNVENGIQRGKRGQPTKYYIRKARTGISTDPTSYMEISPRDKKGRPKILHVYPVRRPGQQRGIPLFAPVLTYFKDLSDYMEAEVVAARVAACLAVFITKNDPMMALDAMSGSSETSGARITELEPGMVSGLNVGEGISVVDPKRPGDSFAPFIETILRQIGVAIGMPYELLVKDFSKTNYSSARAALLEGRRVFMTWRNWFGQKFCQPIWDLVIEEAYLRGEFDAPDFYKWKNEYCRARWIGGAWGWVDPVKEVEASKKAIDYGLSTHAKEVGAQGDDWEETFEQIKREQERAKELEIEIKSTGDQGNQQTDGEKKEDETE